MLRSLRHIWILALSVSGACSGAGNTVVTTLSACVPGASSGCVCDNGRLGAQLCQPDGTFAACECAAANCGNGIVDAGEICDDGNTIDTDGCTSMCKPAACGDGFVEVGVEACDDGNAVANDGCDLDCEPTAVVGLTAGQYHTCALLRSGSVRCWGDGSTGALGYGNVASIGDNETPASAGEVPVGEPAIAISAGADFTCALLAGGALRCWGTASYGQLGYGENATIGDDELPYTAGNVYASGIASVSTSVSSAPHVCVVFDNNVVRCWGYGLDGELGDANTATIGDNELPSSIGAVSIGSVIVQLAAGGYHTCALTSGGLVKCWGSGASGQLGYANTNTIGDNETPSAVGFVNVGGTVTQLAAGAAHTCALLVDGHVRCWGEGDHGELGYGNTNTIGDNEAPASAGDVPLGVLATKIVAGTYFTCALVVGGAVRCWGDGSNGRLGHGTITSIGDNETPASAGDVPIGAAVVDLAAGAGHVCALLASGAVRCWGFGANGELGYGNTSSIGDDETPASAGDVKVF